MKLKGVNCTSYACFAEQLLTSEASVLRVLL